MGEAVTVKCPHCGAVVYVKAFTGKDLVDKCIVCKGAYKVTRGAGDSFNVEV